MIKKALSYITACAILLSPAAIKADRIELGLVGIPAGISVNNSSTTEKDRKLVVGGEEKIEKDAECIAKKQFLWGIGVFGGQMFGDVEDIEIGYEIQAQFSKKSYAPYLVTKDEAKKNKDDDTKAKEKNETKELFNIKTNNVDFSALCKCGFMPFDGGNLYGALGLCGTLSLGNPTTQLTALEAEVKGGITQAKDLEVFKKHIENNLSNLNIGLSAKFGVTCYDKMVSADIFGKFYFLDMYKEKKGETTERTIHIGKNQMDFGVNLAFNFMPLLEN